MRRLVWLWAPVLLWAAGLLFVGSRRGDDLPDTEEWGFPGLDKLAHAGLYGGLGLLYVRAAGARSMRVVLLAAAVGLGWGALDEWIQGTVPGRSADGWDVLADAVGAAVGGWAGYHVFRPPDRS